MAVFVVVMNLRNVARCAAAIVAFETNDRISIYLFLKSTTHLLVAQSLKLIRSCALRL
jgi:hypothetical protein